MHLAPAEIEKMDFYLRLHQLASLTWPWFLYWDQASNFTLGNHVVKCRETFYALCLEPLLDGFVTTVLERGEGTLGW